MNDDSNEYILVIYTRSYRGYDQSSIIFVNSIPEEFYQNDYYFVDNSEVYDPNNPVNRLIECVENNENTIQTVIGIYGLGSIRRPTSPFTIKHTINITSIPERIY